MKCFLIFFLGTVFRLLAQSELMQTSCEGQTEQEPINSPIMMASSACPEKNSGEHSTKQSEAKYRSKNSTFDQGNSTNCQRSHQSLQVQETESMANLPDLKKFQDIAEYAEELGQDKPLVIISENEGAPQIDFLENHGMASMTQEEIEANHYAAVKILEESMLSQQGMLDNNFTPTLREKALKNGLTPSILAQIFSKNDQIASHLSHQLADTLSLEEWKDREKGVAPLITDTNRVPQSISSIASSIVDALSKKTGLSHFMIYTGLAAGSALGASAVLLASPMTLHLASTAVLAHSAIIGAKISMTGAPHALATTAAHSTSFLIVDAIHRLEYGLLIMAGTVSGAITGAGLGLSLGGGERNGCPFLFPGMLIGGLTGCMLPILAPIYAPPLFSAVAHSISYAGTAIAHSSFLTRVVGSSALLGGIVGGTTASALSREPFSYNRMFQGIALGASAGALLGWGAAIDPIFVPGILLGSGMTVALSYSIRPATAYALTTAVPVTAYVLTTAVPVTAVPVTAVPVN